MRRRRTIGAVALLIAFATTDVVKERRKKQRISYLREKVGGLEYSRKRILSSSVDEVEGSLSTLSWRRLAKTTGGFGSSSSFLSRPRRRDRPLTIMAAGPQRLTNTSSRKGCAVQFLNGVEPLAGDRSATSLCFGIE